MSAEANKPRPHRVATRCSRMKCSTASLAARSLPCCAAIRMRGRIASPGMFPEAETLPHLICSRPMFIGGANDEADQHGGA